MYERGGDVVGDPILGSNEELLKRYGDTRRDPDSSTAGDTKPDPDGKKLKFADLESEVDGGNIPG